MNAYPLSCPKLVAGQESLTGEQQSSARHLAQERQAALLSCEPIDESAAENAVHRAYQVVGLSSPHINWCSSPSAFVQSLFLQAGPDSNPGLNVLHDVREELFGEGVYARWWGDPTAPRQETSPAMVPTRSSVHPKVWNQVMTSFTGTPLLRNLQMVQWQVDTLVADIAEGYDYQESSTDGILDYVRVNLGDLGWYSVMAYCKESYLASTHFFHQVCMPNELIHLALLNTMVSGYFLGRERAWLVRKPIHLESDEQGRLHSVTGMCLQYQDGWGQYAWHGVFVPERIICHPGQISLEDLHAERDPEVKRVIRARLDRKR